MRYTDLDLRELLDFRPEGGVVRFAGERVLLMDAVALGLLRKELIERFGVEVARGVLTRFGYIHGWRTAENLKTAFPWDSTEDWRVAGGRLHMLHGLVVFEPVPENNRGEGDLGKPFAEAIWRSSYEAEQHLFHIGRSDDPVCWTLCGFASGYLSYSNDREVFCVETECVGRGDAHCRLVGRPREAWGEAIDPHLPYFRQECLNEALRRVTDEVKAAETELTRRRKALRDEMGSDEVAPGLVARSDAMRQVVELARRVAGVDATVLVTGESGVGKERVARLIHQESPRSRGPFVAINCGAIAESLLESELFGHARGAFTGAVGERAGLFESAAGGTVFLDEVGELTLGMQVKLLRVLQEREVRRVGENRDRTVDVRVVAATHRVLLDDVASGRFRQDLFYRLRVIELFIPPLRERTDDVLPLARLMLSRAAQRLGRSVDGFSPEAADDLIGYAWPGNVRELENAVERAVVLADAHRIEPRDLPREIRASVGATPRPTAGSSVRSLREVEREYILSVLHANAGNQTRTAFQLGIGTATLYRKLRQYEHESRGDMV